MSPIKDLDKKTQGLFGIWATAMLVLVLLLLFGAGGKKIGIYTIHYQGLFIVMITVLVVADMVLRLLAFGSIQSVALDILLFSLVTRISMTLSGSGGPCNDFVLLISIFLFALGVLVYWLFQREYKKGLRGWLLPAFAQPDELVLNDLVASKDAEFWGIFKYDQFTVLRQLVGAYGGGKGKLGQDYQLEFLFRWVTVLSLTILAVLSVFLTSLKITT